MYNYISSKNSGYVFDLDKTLMKDGKIREGVVDILRNIKEVNPNTPIMIMTKMNKNEVTKPLIEIQRQLGDKKLNPILSTNGGGYITNGKTCIRNYIDYDTAKRIRYFADKYAPGAIIIYKTDTHTYREKATQARDIKTKLRKGFTVAFNPILKKCKKLNMPCHPFSDRILNYFCENERVLSLEIVAPEKQLKVLNSKIRAYCSEIVSTRGDSIEITTKTKWNTVKRVFGKDSDKVCFFGSDIDDLECFQKSGKAVCIGSNCKKILATLIKEQRTGKEKFAVNTFKNSELKNFASGLKYSFDKLKENTEKCYINLLEPKRNLNIIGRIRSQMEL